MPPTGSHYALTGEVVTMDAANRILPQGVVYIEGDTIRAVQSRGEPVPVGFERAPVLATRGTIYPGLMELHNHLSYDILPLWRAPRRFENRDQWMALVDKRRYISGPMEVLASTPGCVEAIVRYVECKCLVAGVTTSQGLTLVSDAGIKKKYAGVVRNVELPDHPGLKEARTKVDDVDSACAFLEQLKRASCLLLHLAEGTNAAAAQHFRALQMPQGVWAITDALAGIHALALTPADLATLAQHGGCLVWSPLSNLLLYQQTADVRAAKEAGVLTGIGSDWSPSGSKNLLAELKFARLWSQLNGGVFSDRELVALATTNAARILKWDRLLGSIEPGKLADLVVLSGSGGDPRYGMPTMMKSSRRGSESWTVDGKPRRLNLACGEALPLINALTLAEAKARLREGLAHLPDLARSLEETPRGPSGDRSGGPIWSLVLEEDEVDAEASRPLAPAAQGVDRALEAVRAVPLKDLVVPMPLDELTVVDAPDVYLTRLAAQPNLPTPIRAELRRVYG